MFEMFKSKKGESHQLPTFEELEKALPESLREEFRKVSMDIERINSAKGGAMDGREVKDSDLSDEERSIFARHEELQKMAMDSLAGK